MATPLDMVTNRRPGAAVSSAGGRLQTAQAALSKSLAGGCPIPADNTARRSVSSDRRRFPLERDAGSEPASQRLINDQLTVIRNRASPLRPRFDVPKRCKFRLSQFPPQRGRLSARG